MREIFELVNQMSPYLLLGFLLAGIMHAFVSAGTLPTLSRWQFVPFGTQCYPARNTSATMFVRSNSDRNVAAS